MPDDSVHQPQTVSQLISNYLKMSNSRHETVQPPDDDEPEERAKKRPLIDNERLELDEGNDVA